MVKVIFIIINFYTYKDVGLFNSAGWEFLQITTLNIYNNDNNNN